MPKTLLLADDSVTIQKVVGITFANEDVELVTVDNGDDALIRAREIRPDAVLADVNMPGLDGYALCAELKREPGLAHVPVLLLTGTFEPFDEARASEVGADAHIAKPFEAQALVEQVDVMLARAASARPALPEPEVQEPAIETAPPVAAAEPEWPETSFDDTPARVDAVEPRVDPPSMLAPESEAEVDEALDGWDEELIPAPASVQLGRTPEQIDADLAARTAPPAPVPAPDALAGLDDDLPAPTERRAPVDRALPPSLLEETSFLDPGRSTVAGGDTAPTPLLGFGDDTPDLDAPGESAWNAASDALFDSRPALETPRAPAVDIDATLAPASEDHAETQLMADPLPRAPQTEARPAVLREPLAPEPPAEIREPDPIPPAAAPLARPEQDRLPPVEPPEPTAYAPPPDLDPGGPRADEELPWLEPLPADSTMAGYAPQAAPVTLDPERVHQSLEKIAWEAFGPLSEQLVRDVVAKVEEIAWDVIPQLAERLIREEIERLKRES